MKKLITLLLIVVTALSACTKSRQERKSTKLLTSRVWKCQSLSIGGSAVSDPCLLSDQLTFKEDGTGIQYTTIKCDPSDKDSYHFNWSLSSNADYIYIRDYDGTAGVNLDFKVLELTKSTLEFSHKQSSTEIRSTYISN